MSQLFFTHVMKSGGRSVNRTLLKHVGFDNVYPLPRDESVDAETANLFSIFYKVDPHLLLGLDEHERQALTFVSVHQPAWVAFAFENAIRFTVLRDPVQRTISHLRQIAGAIEPKLETLEELYEIEAIRSRMTNYQTQIFGAPPPDTIAKDFDFKALGEAEKEGIRSAAYWSVFTAIAKPIPSDADLLVAAKENLDRFDVVGVLDDLAGFFNRLSSRSGIDLGEPPHLNAAKTNTQASAALLEAIETDSAVDLELYHHALDLARS
jgi:hypothetical protein